METTEERGEKSWKKGRTVTRDPKNGRWQGKEKKRKKERKMKRKITRYHERSFLSSLIILPSCLSPLTRSLYDSGWNNKDRLIISSLNSLRFARILYIYIEREYHRGRSEKDYLFIPYLRISHLIAPHKNNNNRTSPLTPLSFLFRGKIEPPILAGLGGSAG